MQAERNEKKSIEIKLNCDFTSASLEKKNHRMWKLFIFIPQFLELSTTVFGQNILNCLLH